MKARIPILAITLLLLVSSLAAFASPAAAQDLSGLKGGNLRIAAQAGVDFDPLTMTAADMRYESLGWDTLARPDPLTGEPMPWAAVGWEPNKTAGTITVTIRDDLMWSDGTAITSADVAATFGPTHYGFNASAPDASTIVFDFSDTAPVRFAQAGRFYTEVLYGYIAWTSGGTKKYSGLFAPVNPAASPIVLNANDNHWTGGPNLRTVTVAWPNTVEEAACGLLNEQVDLIGWPLTAGELTTQWASCANLTLVNPDPDLTKPFISAVHHDGPTFLYYGLNVAGGGAIASKELRNALYLLVNKELDAKIEPSTAGTSSLVSEKNLFWHLPSWNVVRDAGFTTIGGRQATDPSLAIAALDAAGYVDRDADGWREDPTGAPVSLEFLAVDFNVDARKTTIVDDFTFTMGNRLGIKAVLVPQPSWAELWANVSSGNYDGYLGVADEATQNPRFLESFAPLVDANDATVNTHLNLGLNSYTLAERVLHFNHVTYYSSLCACVWPVLGYQTQEAYNRDSFTGWVSAFDGVFNVWSIQVLRLPAQGGLHVEVATSAAGVTSGGATTVQVTVLDDGGSAVSGANVALSASGGTLSATSGTTGASGRFSATLTAPAAGTATEVSLSATAWATSYTSGSGSAVVTVHPVARSLVVSVTVMPNNIAAGTQATVTVLVEDAVTRSAVSGATVTLSTSLPGGTLGATSGTTGANGVFSTTFTAKPKVGSIFRIDATASAVGYTGAESAGSVIVAQDFGTYQERTRIEVIPGFETLFVVAALGAALALMRFRRGRREG